jgi:oligopeptide/dipeptide ABC transporter ATP-binding protein
MSGLLAVDGLTVEFAGAAGWQAVVEDATFDVEAGEVVALVGESGSGKSVTSLALMRLLPPGASRVTARRIEFQGRDLQSCSEQEMRAVRGGEIAMIFQEPMTSLNPAFTVGNQLVEAIRLHETVSRTDARRRSADLLDRVGIANPWERLDDYPHQLSGGMRQRVMLAIALACEPRMLIADEPTTALDVTTQAQILELLRSLQAELGLAIVFVTHDLGVVAEICDRVAVMYAGQVVERAPMEKLFAAPQHPYTAALLRAIPQSAAADEPLPVIPGQVAEPGALPPGCRFAPRCAYVRDVCSAAPVPLEQSETDREVRCVRHAELELDTP